MKRVLAVSLLFAFTAACQETPTTSPLSGPAFAKGGEKGPPGGDNPGGGDGGGSGSEGRTSTGLVPLTDLGAGTIDVTLDVGSVVTVQGGLYADGSNERPPLPQTSVAPAPEVPIVGASTANIAAQTAIDLYSGPALFVNCAKGNTNARDWADGRPWDRCAKLVSDPAAIQVVIFKLGEPDAETAEENTTAILSAVHAMDAAFPNVEELYFADEGYGGYADGKAGKCTGDCEPEMYLHATSVREVVLSLIGEGRFASWLTLVWCDGLGADDAPGGVPGCENGTEWERADFGGDGFHKSEQGAIKEFGLWDSALRADPVASLWYVGG